MQVREWLPLDIEELAVFVLESGAASNARAAHQLAADGIVECFTMARYVCATALRAGSARW